jgi:hypothetical protein
MADRRRSRRKSGRQLQKSSTGGEVQMWVSPRSRFRPWLHLLVGLLVAAGLSGGVALLVLSFRWGMLLILDPEALPPLQSALLRPFSPQALTPTTTQTALEQSLAEENQMLGIPIKITQARAETEFLIFPILDETSQTVTELKVFRSQPGADGRKELVGLSSFKVAEFDQDSILAPLQKNAQLSKVQPKALLPSQVVTLPAPPDTPEQVWLTLIGSWNHQGITLRYGQILYFNADQKILEPLTLWSSPAKTLPQWADLDGEGPMDLLIQHTMGMEPSLRGLQVRSQRGIGPAMEVQPIAWVGVPIDAGNEAHRYHKALRLARGGLWQASHDLLADLKSTLADQWNPTAEAQLRLMQHHADIARQQADQSWSMPTQQMLALIVDSRWEAALAQLENHPELLEPLMRRLAADQTNGYIWNRILAATSLPKPDPAVYVWGGLTLKAQQNEQVAQSWLDRQSVPASVWQRYRAALTPPEPLIQAIAATPEASQTSTSQAKADSTTPNSPSESSAETWAIQGIIGRAIPISNPDLSSWYIPGNSGIMQTSGQWYAVDIAAVRTQQRWQTPPLPQFRGKPPSTLWSSFQAPGRPPLQILHWTTSSRGISTALSLKGLYRQDSRVTLLGSGSTPQGSDLPPLVYSNDALVWLDATQSTPPDPNQIAAPIMEAIRQHQGSLDQNFGVALAAVLAQTQLHRMDLTGNGQLEQILTFDNAALDQLQAMGVKLDRSGHKTIVLSHANQMLYSDLFVPQIMVALTNPQHGLPLSLLVLQTDSYRLLTWSSEQQGFQ